MALDLDNFKSVNDTLGHEAGDEVLRQSIDPVMDTIRPTDLFGRTGGEEFLILLSDTSIDTAIGVAERIRVRILENKVLYGSKPISITASFGIALWDRHCDLDELIHRADLALYEAKNKGRNQVCVWKAG